MTWKVNVGDVVVLNQPLVDIETAKATVELPSPYAGTVVALHGNVGDVLEVHKPLITFEVGGGGRPRRTGTPSTTPSEPAPAHERRRTSKKARSAKAARPSSSATASPTKTPSSRASTVVKAERRRPRPSLQRPAAAPVAPAAPVCDACRRSRRVPRRRSASTPNNTASTSRR